MNLFRSEEHLERWRTGRAGGVTLAVAKLAEFAEAWLTDRLAANWRPHTREQNQAILQRVGLVGDFWRLG
jgi:hypothetical protein